MHTEIARSMHCKDARRLAAARATHPRTADRVSRNATATSSTNDIRHKKNLFATAGSGK